MNTTDPRFELIRRCRDNTASSEDLAQLQSYLREHADFREAYVHYMNLDMALSVVAKAAPIAVASTVPAQTRRRVGWQWRPLTAAAAGVMLGMFCSSMLFAYSQFKTPQVISKGLPLADPSFESGVPIPAQGIPARAGSWGGDFSRVVGIEHSIIPKDGQHMLRILRADHELAAKNARSYVGSVAQVIDLRPLRAEFSGGEQLVEVSAQFNARAIPQSSSFEFNVKAAVFRGDIAEAPRLWEEHESSVSRSARSVSADFDAATWQRVSMPLVVPMDADFLVIEAAVVSKTPQSEQSVAEFPGHYVDQVEVRLTSSANAWAVTNHAN